ncbi:hypothetical protein BC829DRAFT_393427, partial [Chytridium lagenaria]
MFMDAHPVFHSLLNLSLNFPLQILLNHSSYPRFPSPYYQTATLTGHEASITSLTHLPSARLLSTSYDSTLRIWSSTTQLSVTTFSTPSRTSGILGCDVLATSALIWTR